MASRSRLEYAIVVKGPMVSFTRACLSHYLATMPSVGVVFSHNRGCAGSTPQLPFLEQLEDRYPATFGFVLADPPPELGLGFRNAQREAVYHGVRRAIGMWGPQWVLVHRPDAAFVQPDIWIWPLNDTVPLHGASGHNVMERLAAVATAQPPVAMPSGFASSGGRYPPLLTRRIGVCPFQMHLSTFYGHFSVDDHCMFGAALDVLEFWSLEPPYCRECEASSELETEVLELSNRNKCRKPGPEQENGILWVERMKSKGWTPPKTTLQLIEQQLWVMNPIAFGYVRFKREDANASVALPLQGDPTLSRSIAFTELFGRYILTRMSHKRHDLSQMCRPLPSHAKIHLWESVDDWKAPVYDCSGLRHDPSDPITGLVAKGRARHLSDWGCPNPLSEPVATNWRMSCEPANDTRLDSDAGAAGVAYYHEHAKCNIRVNTMHGQQMRRACMKEFEKDSTQPAITGGLRAKSEHPSVVDVDIGTQWHYLNMSTNFIYTFDPFDAPLKQRRFERLAFAIDPSTEGTATFWFNSRIGGCSSMNPLNPAFANNASLRQYQVPKATCNTLHPECIGKQGCPCACGGYLLFFCRKPALYKPRQVPTRQLSSFLRERKVERIEYLKIDAQGSDFGILRDVLENTEVKVDHFQLECQFTERAPPFYSTPTTNDCAAIIAYVAQRLPAHTVTTHVNNCEAAEYNLVGSEDPVKARELFRLTGEDNGVAAKSAKGTGKIRVAKPNEGRLLSHPVRQ